MESTSTDENSASALTKWFKVRILSKYLEGVAGVAAEDSHWPHSARHLEMIQYVIRKMLR